MSSSKIEIYIHYRARQGEDLRARHTNICANMRNLPPPFGWNDLPVPDLPDFGKELLATFSVKYPISGLRAYVDYIYREKTYDYKDDVGFDDKMVVSFRLPNSALNYADVLHMHMPGLIQAFHGYLARAYYGYHFSDFLDRHKKAIDKLKQKPGINVNGRNNIFTLHPAQYWDAELCGKALGYGPDEVIRRLDGQVPLVRPLMDGVYTVFNDDPDLSFEEFCAFNDRFKPVLGLV